MLASLPMYFAPTAALDAFWSDLARRMRARGVEQVPDTLTWPGDYASHWLQNDLLISQTCGYPLTHALRGRVALVGSLAYAVPGADGIQCRSQLICRANDPRTRMEDFAGGTVAFNSSDSQSGYNALRLAVARLRGPTPFFRHSIETGGHGKSVESVRCGLADLASIDCVTWALWQEAHPEAAGELRTIGATEPYPGLPLITALSTPRGTVEALRTSLIEAMQAPELTEARQAMHLAGFEATTLEHYQRCLDMETEALALGVAAL